MIYITNIKNINQNNKNTISISKTNIPNIKTYTPLIPKHKTKNHINTQKHYIKKYYLENLKKLDPKTTYNSLDNKIIIYTENELLPIYIFKNWIELFLDIKIEELPNKEEELKYLKEEELKETLEKIIKKDLNIKQNTIKAYYLLKEGEKLQNKAELFIKQNNLKYAHKTLKIAKEKIKESQKIEQEYTKTYQRKR